MILAILLVAVAGVYRLAPHPENVAPVAALALLGGMYFGRRYALWVPLAVLVVTDLVLNARMGYPLFFWPRAFDYAAFMLIGLLGLWARSKQWNAKLGSAVTTPFLFFALSNFGVWLFGLNLANQPYSKSISGLVECYAAGLPFLRGTVIGDWAFMAVFVMAMVLVRKSAGRQLGWLVAEAKA